MTPPLYALARHASETMQGCIDGAVHGGENSVVYMRYQCNDKPRKDAYYGQGIGEHTDSRPQPRAEYISQTPNTAVYSISAGATMEFAIKKIQSKPYEGDRLGDNIRVAPKKVRLTELEAGSLFAWPAGAPSTADWRYKHLAGFTSPARQATGCGKYWWSERCGRWQNIN